MGAGVSKSAGAFVFQEGEPLMAKERTNPATIPAAAPTVELLDRSRHVTEIHGNYQADGMDRPAAFSQVDHRGRTRYYDSSGVRIYLPGEKPDQRTKPSPIPQIAAAKAQPPRGGAKADAPASPASGDEGEINLTAWALRQVRYPFAKVREAISQRYSKVVTDEREAIGFLIEEKAVDGEVWAAWGFQSAEEE